LAEEQVEVFQQKIWTLDLNNIIRHCQLVNTGPFSFSALPKMKGAFHDLHTSFARNDTHGKILLYT
jgi:hypothetical protein